VKQDSKIFWPPDENFAMSVLGFDAAEHGSLKVNVDQEIEIKIASLSGIFLLKIVAWKNRHLRSNKDADDMGFILENYLSIHEERAATTYYDEAYGVEPFKNTTAGAVLLGKDIKELLEKHQEVATSILIILNEELNKKEESKLINQIVETHRSLYYEEILQSIQNIVNGLSQK